MNDELSGLLDALALKALPRAGWARHTIPDPESVAAHSWGVSLLVLSLLPPELDRTRAMIYAVIHDLPEVHAGDITPHDGVPRADKHALEEAAWSRLAPQLPSGQTLHHHWRAYEAQSDPEARFVRQLDRLDMALQAVLYARDTGADTLEFVESALKVIEHPTLRPYAEALRAHEVFDGRRSSREDAARPD